MSVTSHILVIEDDRDIRESLRDLLESEGYGIEEAAHGQQAIDYLSNCSRLPRVILLDLMMPVMNGWQFLAWLELPEASRFSSIPVIIVSAAGEAAAHAVRRAAGLVRKPVEMGELLKAIHKHCPAA